MGITLHGIVPLVNYTCNATCTHCFFRLHKSGTLLSPPMLAAAVSSLRGPLRWIHFSGGEPLINIMHFQCLLRAVTPHHCGRISLDTNGSWGESPEQAQRIVTTLTQSGVTCIHLSADSFHQPALPADHIVHAGRAIADAGTKDPSCLVAVIADPACRDAEAMNYATRALLLHLSTATGLPVAETPLRWQGQRHPPTAGSGDPRNPATGTMSEPWVLCG